MKMQLVNGKPKRKSKRKSEEGPEIRGSWRLLPPDLATKILGLLPLHHAMNAMAVCKQWRAFLLKHSASPAVEGDMLSPLFLSTSWCGYDAEGRRWVRYPNLAFLPFSIARVHSSHRGLVLVEAAETPSALYLCNFATQRHWLLPPLPDAFNQQPLHFTVGRRYWCHCHLHVNEDRHTFIVTALVRANNASGWPQLFRLDSIAGSWSPLQVGLSCTSCSLIPKVFFEGVDRIVVLSNGTIYMMVPGKEGWCYLVKYDPGSCVWDLVSKLQVISAQIVAFGETLMAVALDRGGRQMHLYRLDVMQEEEELVLEESSDADLAGFVESCAIHFWYTAFCPSSCRVYVGVRLTNYNEGDEQLVEYEGLSRTWRRLPLPNFVANQNGDSVTSCRSIVVGDAYHGLGLATYPSLSYIGPP